jgi:hypothetical protein
VGRRADTIGAIGADSRTTCAPCAIVSLNDFSQRDARSRVDREQPNQSQEESPSHFHFSLIFNSQRTFPCAKESGNFTFRAASLKASGQCARCHSKAIANVSSGANVCGNYVFSFPRLPSSAKSDPVRLRLYTTANRILTRGICLQNYTQELSPFIFLKCCSCTSSR